MVKNSNSRHRELKLLRFRRAGRRIIGWLKDKRLILEILRPDIERMCKVEILKQKAYKNKEKIEEYNEEPLLGPSNPQEVASIPETSTVNPVKSLTITHLNELASPSFSHPTNVPPQSMMVEKQKQENEDLFGAMHINSSNLLAVSPLQVYDASFFQGHQSSPIYVTFNQSNTPGVTDFSMEPYEDHINYWPANGSTTTFASADSFWHDFLNLDGSPDFVIQEGHASHESVPSISFQLSEDFTGRALNWHVLKALLGFRMRMKKVVASKKTDKIE